jgi:hypothetical protein
MRKYTVWLLTIVMLSQTFYNVGVTAYWLANHTYIATVLCENKDKPALHCDGKCYLKKKIAAEATQQSSNSTSKMPTLKKGMETVALLTVLPVIPQFLFEETGALRIGTRPNAYSYTALYTIFHPPSVAECA